MIAIFVLSGAVGVSEKLFLKLITEGRPLLGLSMFESPYHGLVALVAFVWLGYIRLTQAITYSGGIPRVGGLGVVGYIVTALRFTLDAESVISEGKTLFSGCPFVIPTLASSFCHLSHPRLMAGV